MSYSKINKSKRREASYRKAVADETKENKMYKEMCGVCGNEADVQLGKIELPHPLYPVFICGECSQDVEA